MINNINNEQTQRLTVREQQQEFCDLFGLQENVIWDLYEHDEKIELEKKINLIIPSPEDNEQEQQRISKIRQDIIESLWEQRKYSGGSLLMSQIFILAVNYETYVNSQQNIPNDTNFEIYTVFRIRKCIDDRNSNKCCMIFVDENARVYQDWDDYKSSNTIPKRFIVSPKRGIYQTIENDEVLLEIFESPACSITQTVLNVADTSSMVGGLGASVLLIGSLFSLPIAAPVIAGAAAVGGICAGYTTLRSGGSLIDRATHNQSNNPINEPEARGHWIGVAGGAASVVAGGATRVVGSLAQGGATVAPIVETAVNVINASALAVNGFGVSNGVFSIITRYRNKESIGKLEILQLSASLFLFTHSVYNFQTASSIIRANQEQTITDYSKTLSNRQRKAFIKAAKETIRLQGGSEGRTQIIRSMNNIPDNLRNSIPVQNEMQGNIASIMPVFDDDDLLENLAVQLQLQNVLSENAYRSFLKFVQFFYNRYGQKINKELMRIVPFEDFLLKAFKVLRRLANDIEGQEFSEYVEQLLLNDINYIDFSFDLLDHYHHYRPGGNFDGVCKTCNGKYYTNFS